MHVDKGSGQLN